MTISSSLHLVLKRVISGSILNREGYVLRQNLIHCERFSSSRRFASNPARLLTTTRLVNGPKSRVDASLRSWVLSNTRSFSSHQQNAASSPLPLKDPGHACLYYHLFEPETSGMPPIFALSLLEDRPPHAHSRTVLGWLPASVAGEEDGRSGLNDFVENASFVSLLHDGVKEGLLHDDIWKNSAIQTQAGWMHIFDQRNPPPLGRIPSPDDIIASVRVDDSIILPETYQAMPSYRVCTTDGVCQLSEGLMESLRKILRDVSAQELRDR